MKRPKENMCEQLDSEGLALIGTSSLLRAGHLATSDVTRVLDASIEALEYWRDILRNGPKGPTKKG